MGTNLAHKSSISESCSDLGSELMGTNLEHSSDSYKQIEGENGRQLQKNSQQVAMHNLIKNGKL